MIEFRCQQCGSTLRVPAGTEGKQAKCPQCGSLMTIPTPAAPADPFRSAPPLGPTPAPAAPADFSAPPPREGAFNQPSSGSAAGPDQDNPFQAPQYAGVPHQQYVAGTRGFRPSPIVFSEVFDRTWQLYKANLGLLLGGGALVFILMMIIDQFFKVLFGVGGAQFGMGFQPDINAGPGAYMLRSFAASLVTQCTHAFFWMGLITLTLKMARGESASLGDLFNAGIQHPAGIVVHMSYVVLLWVGFALCILPGVWFGLAFAFTLYMFLDQRTSIVDSFQYSYRAMRGNMLTMLGLWLVMLGFVVLGFVACFVGIFLAAPFCVMLMTVAYLSATGQLPGPSVQPAPYHTP